MPLTQRRSAKGKGKVLSQLSNQVNNIEAEEICDKQEAPDSPADINSTEPQTAPQWDGRRRPPPARTLSQHLSMAFCKTLLNVYFREVDFVGFHNIPPHGVPTIFFGNHQNQFVDGAVLFASCGRPVSFIIAEKSLHQPVVGSLARSMLAIGVTRPQDKAFVGAGEVVLIKTGQTTELRGSNTKFHRDLIPGCSVKVANNGDIPPMKVLSVESHTRAVVSCDANTALITPTKFKVYPHIDHLEMYAQVNTCLANGGSIGIFPEGGSHDRTELLPLKTGMVNMALGFVGKHKRDLQLVPCGLNYYHAHRFRSRIVLEFGPPITVTPQMQCRLQEDGRLAKEALLERCHSALKDVTLNVPDYETMSRLQLVRKLFVGRSRKLNPKEYLALSRRLISGSQQFKTVPQVVEVMKEVEEYKEQLRRLGLKDSQVSTISCISLPHLINCLLTALLMLLLGAPGLLLNSPVAAVAVLISKKKAVQALRGSSVKIAGRDVISSWKIIATTVLLPLAYSCYTAIAWWYCQGYLVRRQWGQWAVWLQVVVPMLVLLALPVVSYCSLLFYEEFLSTSRELITLLRLCCNTRQVQSLQKTRRQIKVSIRRLVEELGPQVQGLEEWEKKQIIRTSSFSDLAGLTCGNGRGLYNSSSYSNLAALAKY